MGACRLFPFSGAVAGLAVIRLARNGDIIADQIGHSARLWLGSHHSRPPQGHCPEATAIMSKTAAKFLPGLWSATVRAGTTTFSNRLVANQSTCRMRQMVRLALTYSSMAATPAM